MPIEFFLSVYLVLTFDIFNIKILIISFFKGLFIIYFFIKKTHEPLKAEHLRFKIYNL